jgi:hypothetical protein
LRLTGDMQLARRYAGRDPARAVLAFLAQRYTGVTLDELAPLLGVARAASVPYLVRRAARADLNSEIASAIQQIEGQLQLS